MTIAWTGNVTLDAVLPSVASILACIAGLVRCIRRIVSPTVMLPVTLEWLDELPAERHRAMLRLLKDPESSFLGSHQGVTEAAANSRRARYRLLRGYLRALTIDFRRVCTALKVVMAQASTDRPDLAATLLRSQMAFTLGMAVVQARLLLSYWGMGTVDIARPLKLLDGMRLELRALLAAGMPSV